VKAVKKGKAGQIMVKAPEGYHWMTERGRYFLMKHEGEFKPHKGAALEVPFKEMKYHAK
jgi:hypothetical protein